ncbi:hypothetical protein EVAR_14734_1 [Eumeta japonica]|uniref:Uncharacterized protein n=1 Tax=Eumeta variegata TaxID=151549 RepID=A0A4C1TWB4_EUMVA|nr:hypothetical protein EVAR_14734_1 [Eumeta japonica]
MDGRGDHSSTTPVSRSHLQLYCYQIEETDGSAGMNVFEVTPPRFPLLFPLMPSGRIDNALVTPVVFRVFMGDGDSPLSYFPLFSLEGSATR